MKGELKIKTIDMIKTLAVTVLVGLLAFDTSSPEAAITSRKIDGYQEAKWGMSPGEVKEAFPTQDFSSLKKVRYFSDEYPRLLLTKDLVSTFSFIDTILEKSAEFRFYFYKNQLYGVELGLYPMLEDKYFKWIWEIIEQKYKPVEGGREPSKFGLSSWKDAEGNGIWLSKHKPVGLNLENITVYYTNAFMDERLRKELKKLEEEKAKKRRQELGDVL